MKNIHFTIKEIEVDTTADWNKIQKQVEADWKRLGQHESDKPPVMPNEVTFERWTDTKDDLVIEWNLLRDWIRDHGFYLQENGKVVPLPRPKWGAKKIDGDSPYAGDALKRNEQIGDLLTQLLKTQNEPLVLAINGAWGSGKTTLLNMWIPAAEKKFTLVHFNAWETDYAKDPLIALVAELKDKLKGIAPEDKLCDFMRIVGSVALKGLSGGLLCTSDFSPDEMKAKSQKSSEKLLAEYEGTRNLLNTFKEKLAELAASIDNKPLVFVIDELDRCRPTYAIELLERIKHLFSVKGVCFVLALDKKQLGESIKAVYGNIHTEGYLRRFIDLTYNLPEANTKDFVQMLLERSCLLDYVGGRSVHEGAADWIQKSVSYSSGVFGFSLRDIEHVVRQIALASRATTSNKILSPLILSVLGAIKFHDEPLYHSFCQGNIGADDVLTALPTLHEDSSGEDGHMYVEAVLRYIDQKRHWHEWLQETENKDVTSKIEQEQPDMLRQMVKHLQSWHRSTLTHDTAGLLKYLYEKLELVQPLVG